MNTIKQFLTLISLLVLVSCARNTANQPATAEGFSNIETALKKKFGNNAYYTTLTINCDKTIGNIIGGIVTKDPASLKMEQWHLTQNTWSQSSDITVEVPKGAKAKDFMFQLDSQINLYKLGELVETSKKQLITDRKLERPTLHMAFIKFPKNGDLPKTQYVIMLQPEDGGTKFNFYYTIKGDLITMDY